MFKLACAAAAFIGYVNANTQADDVNGVFPDSDNWTSGFVNVQEKNSDLFYWLFDSRDAPDTDPLVLWLTGGPGCASEIALFYENGPFHFDAENNLDSNPHAWNTNANLLYVDQPIGTGYSKAGVKQDVKTEKAVAEDMATLLKGFLD